MQNTEHMWQAVVGCDGAYDGAFVYAVRTVGVYCRPSCKSRTPLRKNVLYFRGKEEAEAAGFRPCKRCRPDWPDYEPAQFLAEQMKRLVDVHFGNRQALSAALAQLGVSANRASAVFKQQYGLPPMAYLMQVRAAYAKERLAETSDAILQIAGALGYDSLSAFYAFFRKQAGVAPNAYRAAQRGEER